jgi:hypothetical protein
MAEMKIFIVELIDESWFYVFATSKRDAVHWVSRHYDVSSLAKFRRKYDPIVRIIADGETIYDGDNEKTAAEWLASCEADHPGCWLSNTYED